MVALWLMARSGFKPWIKTRFCPQLFSQNTAFCKLCPLQNFDQDLAKVLAGVIAAEISKSRQRLKAHQDSHRHLGEKNSLSVMNLFVKLLILPF